MREHSPCPMIIFFNLFQAMRHAVKVIFSLGPMIAQPVPTYSFTIERALMTKAQVICARSRKTSVFFDFYDANMSTKSKTDSEFSRVSSRSQWISPPFLSNHRGGVERGGRGGGG